MKDISLYTWRTCPFCHKAKKLLNDGGYEFTEYDITDRPDIKEALTARHGQSSVPYVFIEDELIGGSSDLEELMLNDLFEDKIKD